LPLTGNHVDRNFGFREGDPFGEFGRDLYGDEGVFGLEVPFYSFEVEVDLFLFPVVVFNAKRQNGGEKTRRAALRTAAGSHDSHVVRAKFFDVDFIERPGGAFKRGAKYFFQDRFGFWTPERFQFLRGQFRPRRFWRRNRSGAGSRVREAAGGRGKGIEGSPTFSGA